MYVKIYYSCLNGTAVGVETYDYDEYLKNKEQILKGLLSKDEDPMDLDIQLFDEDSYFITDLIGGNVYGQ